MAFNIDNVLPVGGASQSKGASIYRYANEDNDDVTAVGYFNDLVQKLIVGDTIEVISYNAGVPSTVVPMYLVTAVNKTTGVVTIAVTTLVV